MRRWLVAIDVHIPRRRWQSSDHPFQILSKLDLTTQPRRITQTESQIQHVILIIGWFRKFIKLLRREDYVTCGACYGAFTCTFQIYVVFMCQRKEIVSLVSFDSADIISFGISECHLDTGSWSRAGYMAMPRD